jgi:hypothetical protein
MRFQLFRAHRASWARSALIFVFLSTGLQLPLAVGRSRAAEVIGVPSDAIAVARFRLADLWKSVPLRDLRALLLRAGPEAIRMFDERFVPAPSSIDQVTVCVRAPLGTKGPPVLTFLLTTSKAFDPEALVKRSLPGAQALQVAGTAYHVIGKTGFAVRVINDRTLLFGPTESVQATLENPPRMGGPLAEIVNQATAHKPIVSAVNVAALPPIPREGIPPQFTALLDAKLVTATVELDNDLRLDLSMEFPDAAKAQEGEKSVHAAIELARQGLAMVKGQMEAMAKGTGKAEPGALSELPEAVGGLFGLAFMQSYDDLLKNLPVERREATLHLSLEGSPTSLAAGPAGAGVAIGLLLPAVQKVREAANRVKDQNNLKQIALAMHNFHDANGHFPAAAICDKAGKPLLSWRVAILPYIEQNNLYRQFKLDEPWDSAHNLKLLDTMPATYALPSASGEGATSTHYRVFTGADAGFEYCKGRRFADITDGTSNTWMVVEAADPVPWTKPDELAYDRDKPVRRLGNFFAGGFNVAFMDGSVHFFPKPPAEKTMRAYITPAGGEVIPQEGGD